MRQCELFVRQTITSSSGFRAEWWCSATARHSLRDGGGIWREAPRTAAAVAAAATAAVASMEREAARVRPRQHPVRRGSLGVEEEKKRWNVKRKKSLTLKLKMFRGAIRGIGRGREGDWEEEEGFWCCWIEREREREREMRWLAVTKFDRHGVNTIYKAFSLLRGCHLSLRLTLPANAWILLSFFFVAFPPFGSLHFILFFSSAHFINTFKNIYRLLLFIDPFLLFTAQLS